MKLCTWPLILPPEKCFNSFTAMTLPSANQWPTLRNKLVSIMSSLQPNMSSGQRGLNNSTDCQIAHVYQCSLHLADCMYIQHQLHRVPNQIKEILGTLRSSLSSSVMGTLCLIPSEMTPHGMNRMLTIWITQVPLLEVIQSEGWSDLQCCHDDVHFNPGHLIISWDPDECAQTGN